MREVQSHPATNLTSFLFSVKIVFCAVAVSSSFTSQHRLSSWVSALVHPSAVRAMRTVTASPAPTTRSSPLVRDCVQVDGADVAVSRHHHCHPLPPFPSNPSSPLPLLLPSIFPLSPPISLPLLLLLSRARHLSILRTNFLPTLLPDQSSLPPIAPRWRGLRLPICLLVGSSCMFVLWKSRPGTLLLQCLPRTSLQEVIRSVVGPLVVLVLRGSNMGEEGNGRAGAVCSRAFPD